MHQYLQAFVFSILALAFSQGACAHHIVACEPEWAALAKELGGEKNTVYSATTGLQDPHHIEARPSLIAMARNADLLICTGLGVEGGWLPILLANSGNPRIQRGQPGYLEAGDYVLKLDVPTSLDRAQGDVHALGNHHLQNDPYKTSCWSPLPWPGAWLRSTPRTPRSTRRGTRHSRRAGTKR